MTLRALFLTLAAYQILPFGFNLISDLGVWSLVLSYSTLSIGFTAMIIGSVRSYQIKQHNLRIDHHHEGVLGAYYSTITSESDHYFTEMIHDDELFAMFNPFSTMVTIYYREPSVKVANENVGRFKALNYKNDPKEAFDLFAPAKSFSCRK